MEEFLRETKDKEMTVEEKRKIFRRILDKSFFGEAM